MKDGVNTRSQFDLLIATDYPQCQHIQVESIWSTDRGQILIDQIQQACPMHTSVQLQSILESKEMRFVEEILQEELGDLLYESETNTWRSTDNHGKFVCLFTRLLRAETHLGSKGTRLEQMLKPSFTEPI